MNYCNIKDCDIANGIGIRVTLFVSGCTNHCTNCFQPQTWDFNYGQPFTREVEDRLIEMLSRPYIHGLTLLGGEPFEPANQRVLLPFLRRVREALPNKTIWAFSGFRYDDELLNPDAYPHCETTEEMLSLCDILVDGRFIEARRDISLQFRGSDNQRLIDLVKTRETGVITLWHDQPV